MTPLNILFINPPNNPFTSKGILIEPIDLLDIASYAQNKGFKVSALDMDVNELVEVPEFYLKPKPDLVVIIFDYHIPLHDKGANSLIAKIIRDLKNKNISCALAGKFASFGSEKELSEFNADFYIYKDLEPFIDSLELVNSPKEGQDIDVTKAKQVRNLKITSILENGKGIEKNSKDFLKKYPIANRKLLDISKYIDVRTILTSRGCNLKCTFCHVPGFWGNWVGKSPKTIVDELHYLQNTFNAKKILFLDDNATANKRHVQSLISELKIRPISAKFGMLSSLLSYDKELFHQLHEEGLRWVHFGAESGDDQLLSDMRKNITFNKTRTAVQDCKDIGIRLRTSWILDMPNTNEAALGKTIDAILELKTPEIRLHYLTLRLGSYLHEKFNITGRQFIHSSHQNINLSLLSSDFLTKKVDNLLSELTKLGYTIVTDPRMFENVDALRESNPSLKIVALCPLRYGLNWT